MIQFGDTQISDIWFGNNQIRQVWVGNTQVYPTTIVVTYQLSAATIHYSSGTQLLPNRSNYAYITATVKEYHNGALYDTRTENITPLRTTFESMNEYFSIEGERIYFNKADFGKEDLYSIFGNVFYTSWIGGKYDLEIQAAGNLITESNKLVEDSTVVTVGANQREVSWQGARISATPYAVYERSWTSGESEEGYGEDIAIYLDGTLIGYADHGVAYYFEIPENMTYATKEYQIKATYNNSNGYTYVEQSARPSVVGMHLYYIEGGYYIEDQDTIDDVSSQFSLRDDGYNDNRYSIDSNDPNLFFEIDDNVILVGGITSSTDARITITEEGSGDEIEIFVYGI